LRPHERAHERLHLGAGAGERGVELPQVLVEPLTPRSSRRLQEQLGLKLEAKKVSLEVMAVDRFESPIED